MSIISFGRFDKKLLLMVLMLVVQTAYLIAMYEGIGLYQSNLVTLEDEVSSIIGGIILHFIFRNKKVNLNTQKKNKKCFIYIIILFLLRVIHSAIDYCYPYFAKEQKYRLNNILSSLNGI